jgi:hypothetical protein
MEPTRAGVRAGSLVNVIGGDPGCARRVQITGEDATYFAEADDRGRRHARPRPRS